jgi:hypothetical protein
MIFSRSATPDVAQMRLFFGHLFAAEQKICPIQVPKFAHHSFGRFTELALFPESDDRTEYVDDNELGDARGDGLGGSWRPPHRRYQDSV